jgi:prepilin-type N-terminal cleavage/methylation domain-containing protein
MNTPATNPSSPSQSAAVHLAGSPRAGFTLLELLVVMVIITTLTAMVLAGLSLANETAKLNKTRATIAKIHGQLVQRWAEFETRRVKVPAGTNPQAAETQRLTGLWELQRIELPDNYADLAFPPSTFNARREGYRLAIQQAGKNPDVPDPAEQHASAECLYLIVMVGNNDGEEIRFLESEVGDKDQDRMPEFLDAWGRPIEFIRWAPGYVPRLGADTDVQRDDPPNSAPPLSFQPDPFDRRGLCRPGSSVVALNPPNNTVSYGFKLLPLVYSWGPDGEAGLYTRVDTSVGGHPYARINDPDVRNASVPPDAYLPAQLTDDNVWRGTPIVGLEGGGHLDNITNHRLGTR